MKILKILAFFPLLFCHPALAQEAPAYTYSPVTVESLSKFYWTNDKLYINNDTHIDNYLRINECQIYTDYRHNDIEWQKIRNSSREMIESQKAGFPVRFEFTQPLRLSEYDVNTHVFGILPQFQINGVRRFEVYSTNALSSICGTEDEIDGYPRGLAIEISRPLTITSVPADEKTAKRYIEMKNIAYTALDPDQQNQENLYHVRDAYLVLKIHASSYTEDHTADRGLNLAGVTATLEGYDIYADQQRTLLLHSENFLKRKEASDMEKQLIEEYEASKKAQEAPAPSTTP